MSIIGNYRRLTERELDALLAQPETITDILYGKRARPEKGRQLDVDKAWHAIHFLLNGTQWGGKEPLVNAVLGGTEVSKEDVGYGPARYLRPTQVAETWQALREISAEQLWSRFDAAAMEKAAIYPGFAGEDADRKYICTNFENIKSFFAAAASNGDSMLLYIN